MAASKQTQDRLANGKAIAARSEAVRALILAHADEFGQLLTAQRVSRGLPAEAGGDSTKELQVRLEKIQAKEKKLKEDLAARGIQV